MEIILNIIYYINNHVLTHDTLDQSTTATATTKAHIYLANGTAYGSGMNDQGQFGFLSQQNTYFTPVALSIPTGDLLLSDKFVISLGR